MGKLKRSTNALRYLHSYVALLLFVGMLAVAGLSLFALSPISVEDYQIYKSAKQPGAQVAGVVTGLERSPVTYVNLLERRALTYSLTGDYKNLNLAVSDIAKDRNSPLDLLQLRNETGSERVYRLVLTPNISEVGLATVKWLDLKEVGSDITDFRIYELRLPPGEITTLQLVAAEAVPSMTLKLKLQPEKVIQNLP